jgi:NADH-quinone oxidoreductase subunit H
VQRDALQPQSAHLSKGAAVFADFLIVLVKVLLVLFALLSLAGLLTWAERKQSAVMQDRIGPNRANLGRITALGLLHPLADGIKMITKEDFIPEGAHRTLHTLAPAAAMFPALVVFAVIPFGDVVYLFGREIPLQVANLNVGIVYIFAVSSLAVYGTMLAGWASNNNYALLGGLRASSQMISYELSMGLSILGLLMIYQSAQLEVIVRQQGELLWGFLPMWGIFLQPLAFCLFLAAALAENKRVPFDLPEGESEIIGYFVEYSSMKFGMFFLAEFVEIIIVAGLTTTLFFGGWQVPYLQADGFHWPFALGMWALPHWLVVCMQVGAFSLKVLLGCWILLVVRWTLPRFRYDQVMRLGWKVLLPLALVNLLVTAIVVLLVT